MPGFYLGLLKVFENLAPGPYSPYSYISNIDPIRNVGGIEPINPLRVKYFKTLALAILHTYRYIAVIAPHTCSKTL